MLLWKKILKKLKVELPSDPTSRHLPEETQNTNQKRSMYLYVHCSVIYNSQDREATQGLINRQMDKEDVEYIYIYVI